MSEKEKPIPPCRRCLIIRYFLVSASLFIVCIPIAGSKFEPLKHLTAWHFVAIIFAIGIAGLIFKYIFEMPRYSDEEIGTLRPESVVRA